ncbi:unnamed protein product [Caenorhabditis angaria]|uniref:Tyrosine-protein phosphatase domain-containing protein n=1 Tax=Caenorhabditis angaria TaxID=860376 RepID=A0A9P1IN94_9PELO|nr:unnamed protein product [Caenorhabditis angaria]
MAYPKKSVLALSPEKNVNISPVKLKPKLSNEKDAKKQSNEKINIDRTTLKIDWQKGINDSIDKKMKEFVEKVYKIESEKRLGPHFLANLINIPNRDQKFTNFLAFPGKNRNPDVFCLETTRVKLKNSSSERDYIHANYISIENSKKAYIVTQHPMTNTIEDFWSMVVNEHVEVIVSLTNLVGPDFPQFYPKSKYAFVEFGNYQVICKSVIQGSLKYGPLLYNLEIVRNGCSHGANVQLMKYSHWAKNLVPVRTKVVLSILKQINKTKFFGPVLVQCETGINQSAALIYCDAMISLLLDNKSVDIDTVFQNIRKQRASMLSQRIHFIYSIYVVLDFIRMRFKNNKTMPEVVKIIENIEKPIIQEFSKYLSVETNDMRTVSPTSTELLF